MNHRNGKLHPCGDLVHRWVLLLNRGITVTIIKHDNRLFVPFRLYISCWLAYGAFCKCRTSLGIYGRNKGCAEGTAVDVGDKPINCSSAYWIPRGCLWMRALNQEMRKCNFPSSHSSLLQKRACKRDWQNGGKFLLMYSVFCYVFTKNKSIQSKDHFLSTTLRIN